MVPLREATKAGAVMFVVLAAIALWWQWPEDTVSGVWIAQVNGETLQLTFLQQANGDLQGHGIIITDATHTAAAAGKIEGIRVGNRLTINLSSEKQQTFTVLLEKGPRSQLVGEYFKPGAKSLPITLSKK